VSAGGGPVRFGIVGGGWRAAFYLRVARELPDRFQVTGVVTRDPARGQRLAAAWQIAPYLSLEDLLHAGTPDFVVVSVPRAVAPDIIDALVKRDVSVLVETPPALDLDGLRALYARVGPRARMQVAEQYPFQPMHAARLALAASGLLGTPSQAQISVAHGYHGMALLRRALGLGFEDATIVARRVSSPIIEGPGRLGEPTEERERSSEQIIAQLDFGSTFGVYDFCGDQYFSWIRGPRWLIRGERGEINGTQVRYLADFRTPIVMDLRREDAGRDGNLEGYYHKGILAGERWVFRNPLAPGRLSDDEIAVGTCLDKMACYVKGGESFYGLAEASQDLYLSLMVDEAVASGAAVRTSGQPWAEQ
jgi:predicted dehydrogenase